jgi:hypothetical protein
MVEIEVHKSELATVKTQTATLDLNELVDKVRDFVDKVKEMNVGGEPMAVSVDGFNFSVGKAGDKYDLKISVNLGLKPKADNFVFPAESSTLIP